MGRERIVALGALFRDVDRTRYALVAERVSAPRDVRLVDDVEADRAEEVVRLVVHAGRDAVQGGEPFLVVGVAVTAAATAAATGTAGPTARTTTAACTASTTTTNRS